MFKNLTLKNLERKQSKYFHKKNIAESKKTKSY